MTCKTYSRHAKSDKANFHVFGLRGIRLFLCVLFCSAALSIVAPISSAHAQPLEYKGENPFKNSKHVENHFYLSEDVHAVEKIDFKVDTLQLKPENEKSGVDKVTLSGAGFTDKTVYKIIDGKLQMDSFFVCDLTVIDSCIYGKIGIKYKTDDGVMAAAPVYVVIPNITTPKTIPENILKP